MAIPVLPGCYKVTLRGHNGIIPADASIHVLASPTANQIDIADEVAQAWRQLTSITALQSSLFIGDDVSVQHYDGVSSPTDVSTASWHNQTGGATNTPEPPNVCALITWRTGLAGRAHRGRTYVAFPESGHLNATATQWNATFISKIQTAGDAFIANIASSTTVDALVVYSHKLNTATPVTSCLGRPYFGSQRRRSEAAA